jgi:hypothetical protein
LEVAPVLASWDKAGSPSQQRLAGFLAAAQEALSPQLSGLTSGLALRLDVGLQTSVDVLAERDLDNYLYPLVSYLSKPHGGSDEVVARAFVSAFATKGHAARVVREGRGCSTCCAFNREWLRMRGENHGFGVDGGLSAADSGPGGTRH